MIDFIVETNNRYIDVYLRLSRDDRNKGHSVSIENQDRMLTKFAEDFHYIVRHRYIDDGESGYTFNRPDFDKLKIDIKQGIVKRLLIKDMSRLGRHNARALLFMEEAKDVGCEVIALDDNYSNYQDNDCTIGIKTWHNELYVKESSKKVKNVIHMKQEDGEWLSTPPYGYQKKQSKKSELEIELNNAKIVKRIFEMYADGKGMQMIAYELTQERIMTPSRYLHEMRKIKGMVDKHNVSDKWNDQTIRRILTNEVYLGTLIQHKGECNKIRGNYKQFLKDKWKVFENHHDAIINKDLFERCQKRLSNKKIRTRRKQIEKDNLFYGYLYCGECNSLLKPYHTTKDKRIGNTRYYCATYLKLGKKNCSSKAITEEQLKKGITVFLKRCREVYREHLHEIVLNPISKTQSSKNIREEIKAKEYKIDQLKLEVKQVLENKTKESMLFAGNYEIIQEAYQSLMDDKIKQIESYKQEITLLNQNLISINSNRKRLCTALDILDDIIDKQDYTKEDIGILFKNIMVYENYVEFQCSGRYEE